MAESLALTGGYNNRAGGHRRPSTAFILPSLRYGKFRSERPQTSAYVLICPHLSAFDRTRPPRHTDSPGPTSESRLFMPRFPPIPAKSTPETVERAPIHHVKEHNGRKNKHGTYRLEKEDVKGVVGERESGF